MFRTVLATAALLSVLPALSHVALAQQATSPPVTAGAQANPAIKRTPLQMFDVAGTNQTAAMMRVDVIPNGQIGRHTHPGVESGYVLSGDMVLIIDGQPDRTLKAGESYQIPSGAIHDGKAGSGGAAVIATFVVEKGKPMATPAAPK